LPSAPISVLGKNFSKPPSKGLEAAELGPVPWDARGSTRTHNGIEHHPSWHPNLRSRSPLPTGLPVYCILGNLASGVVRFSKTRRLALPTLGCSVNSFGVAAGLGFEPRLTDPPEPFSFTDRSRHRGTGGDKTALLSSFSSLRGTGRDRERHPVAVRLRSKPGTQQTSLRAGSRRRLPKHIFSAARSI
jgi:hypothetical protein